MKTIQIMPALFVITMTMINCSTESNNETNEEKNAKEIINLSGDDTSAVGTSLEVGDIEYGRVDLTGLEDSIVIVPKGATISEDSPTLSPGDPGYVESIIDFQDSENGFIIVAGEEVISMTIVVDGVQRQYGCESNFGTFTVCGEISIDKNSREAVFTDTTVLNIDTGTILTMNGTVQW